MNTLSTVVLVLVLAPINSMPALLLQINQEAANPSSKVTRSAGFSDLSSEAIRLELEARGLDPAAVATPSALREAFTEYDFQAGAIGLNSSKKEPSEAAKDLSVTLSQTSLQSHVTIRTQKPGARIWYRLIGRDLQRPFNQLTNNAEEDLSIGLYYVWAERDGKATSSKEIIFRIIQKEVPVDLVEVNQ